VTRSIRSKAAADKGAFVLPTTEHCRDEFREVVTRDALFDIGADGVSLLVPGGGIAVRVARLAIDRNQKS